MRVIRHSSVDTPSGVVISVRVSGGAGIGVGSVAVRNGRTLDAGGVGNAVFVPNMFGGAGRGKHIND